MHRFLLPQLPTAPTDRPLALDEAQAHHARKVLRVRAGEAVELFDGAGRVAEAAVADPRAPTVRIHTVTTRPAPRPPLDVAAAVPKGPRAETMVAQLVQAGADRFVPLQSRRAVVTPRPGKLERFERVAREAARQSGRAHLMTVAAPQPLSETLAEGHGLRLLASGAGELAPSGLVRAERALLLVGPEGGWHPDEEAAAAEAPCRPWRLGPHVLRVETAAVVGTALARYLAASDEDCP